MTAILGLSAFYHDSAAALVVDGKVVAAAQQERFSRRKHDEQFPTDAIRFCLNKANLEPDQIDYVAFHEKPLLKFDRLLETYLAYAPVGFRSFLRTIPSWLQQKLHLPGEIRRGLGGKFRRRVIFAEHHQSHAAAAFFPSPFSGAAILTIDGVGEWATASIGKGDGHRVTILDELHFPHSPGLLYSAFTYFCGFRINGGEYKLMGLAPYGRPIYADLILEKIVDLKEDGSIRLDMSFFQFCQGSTMTSRKFDRLFGGPPRIAESEITQREKDLAASVQLITEQIMLAMARHAHHKTGMENLVLAGGVALNCVGNGRIVREGPFDRLWVQPAAGDAGSALGVALLVWYQLLGNERTRDESCHDIQHGSQLGPAFSETEIRAMLDRRSAEYQFLEDDQKLCDHVSAKIAEGNIVGWFQGPMEFGPRALGNRSILADPRDPQMQSRLNQKIKFRESFRPFAPAVLAERASEYFEVPSGCPSPYMNLVVQVQPSQRVEPMLNDLTKLTARRSTISAVTHVDYSARVQTVDGRAHPRFVQLLRSFDQKTGCPVLINTSFNVRGEPIVCTPEEAYGCFQKTEMDMLVMERFVIRKVNPR